MTVEGNKSKHGKLKHIEATKVQVEVRINRTSAMEEEPQATRLVFEEKTLMRLDNGRGEEVERKPLIL